eukprot:11418950-Alexandrium_andersonii.AAC.1
MSSALSRTTTLPCRPRLLSTKGRSWSSRTRRRTPGRTASSRKSVCPSPDVLLAVLRLQPLGK